MNKDVLNYVIEKTHELINAPSCCSEAKNAAKSWLDSIGTDNEAEERKKYIKEIEQDILPIDMLIAFTASEDGKKVFGDEKAKQFNAHGIQIKENGAKYCDCPACSAVLAILEKKNEILN